MRRFSSYAATVKCACAIAVLLLLSAGVDAFELPLALYTGMKGDWSVEVASPCSPQFAHGAATIANTSSSVHFSDETSAFADVPLKAGSASSTSGPVLHALGGLEPFLFSAGSKGDLKYVVCRTQTNYLETTWRPVYGDRMKVTQLTEVTGVLVAAEAGKTDADPCARGATTSGEITMRLVGMPMVSGAGEENGEVKEAVQYVEILIDARAAAGSCAAVATKEGGASEKKKTRKRRGVRNTVGTSEASSADAEVSVANGVTLVRLMKKSPPAKSMMEKWSPAMVFAGLFVIYRIVYGYFSYSQAS